MNEMFAWCYFWYRYFARCIQNSCETCEVIGRKFNQKRTSFEFYCYTYSPMTTQSNPVKDVTAIILSKPTKKNVKNNYIDSLLNEQNLYYFIIIMITNFACLWLQFFFSVEKKVFNRKNNRSKTPKRRKKMRGRPIWW